MGRKKKDPISEAYPEVESVLADLRSQNIQPTDKAIQALSQAIKDADERRYKRVYKSSVTTGIAQAQSNVSFILSKLGGDMETLAERVHQPYLIHHDELLVNPHEYLKPKQAIRRKHYKKTKYRVAPSHEFNVLFRPALTNEKGQSILDTESLFLEVLNDPHIWAHVRGSALSVNKIRYELKHAFLLEPDPEVQKLCIGLERNRFTVDAFDLTDVGTVARVEELPDTGLLLCRVNHVAPDTHPLIDQLREFEWLINQSKISEHAIQHFFEQHPNFLLGLEHKRMHSQLTLTRESAADLRPDFFLERIDMPFCDILDLKLPDKKLVVGSANRRTFSSHIISAMGQLKEYRKYFEDSVNRKLFYKSYGLNAYKPRVQVVIGRRSSFASPHERRELEEELSHLQILTYDDIIDRVRRQLQLVTSFNN